ncbi:DNA-directed RNA polymerase, mitochondrial-like [Clytia hemisphaerica]
MKSIDTTKMNDKKTKKRADQYKEITQKWRNDFITEINQARETRSKKAFLYQRCITYSCVLPAEEIADIIIEEIVPVICGQPQGIPVNFICRKLGHLIYNRFTSKYKGEAGVSEKVQRIMEEYTSSEEWIDKSLLPRQKWKEISLSLPYLASEQALPNVWPTKLRAMASSVLLDILKKVAEIDTKMFVKSNFTKIEQALSHHHELSGGPNRIGVLKFHPVVGRLFKSYLSQMGELSFESNKLPMLIPPRPWTNPTSGAYMLLHSDLVRTVTGQYKLNQLQSAAEDHQMDKIFDSLNYLGNTAWKINEPILDMMITLYNTTGDIKLDIIGPNLPNIERVNAKRKMTWEERKSRQRKKKLYHELFALRMDILYKLSVANHFRSETFWIPSNLDFRGRVYPIAPHCSHIGSDISRCLLMFAEGKKLGPNGLNWLKVHLVNIHGQLKKSSLEERINYADQHLEEIFDSADKPFEGEKWWQGGSDPWQTLVACIEVTKAIRSGDPENYISHIPIQQDGSCNGLQHYATLGRDEYGAKQVNLSPADRPADVYSEVASLVESARQKDADSGVLIAQQLDGKINRKVVKQTVMTVVYGVTFVGGRLQVEKQLKDIGVESDILFKASVYVVQGVFKSLTEIFTTARQIQDWLTISAAQIALTGNCVDWTTPLGLPIIQPYHRETTENISTPLQIVTTTQSYDYTQIPHLTKQKGGFPPNFVHSLDSTHMMMTSLRCQDNHLTYASVHDSFWTHAIDVEKMNKYCREEFVALHSLPILEDLKKHFEEKYAGLPLRKPLKDGRTVAHFDALPDKGSFVPEKVIDSVYFFS